jgi:hypothetical protein
MGSISILGMLLGLITIVVPLLIIVLLVVYRNKN